MNDPGGPRMDDARVRVRALTIEQVREAVPMARSTVYELIRKGELSVLKIGRRTYVTPGELDRFIARLAGSGGEQSPSQNDLR